MRKAILLGAGGHSRVVVSILCEIRSHSTVGIVDISKAELDAKNSSELIMGLPVLSQNELKKFMGCKELDIFLAIGDCSLRNYWWEKILNMGFPVPNLLSPNAIVHSSVSLGSANVICSGVFIGPEVHVGSNNLINTGSILEHESFIGSNCHIAPRSIVAGRAHVGDSCFLGAGSVIINNINVADFTTVGAGAVITADIINSNGVYVGVPARRVDQVSK